MKTDRIRESVALRQACHGDSAIGCSVDDVTLPSLDVALLTESSLQCHTLHYHLYKV